MVFLEMLGFLALTAILARIVGYFLQLDEDTSSFSQIPSAAAWVKLGSEEEEEALRKKTMQILESVPCHDEDMETSAERLRLLLRNEIIDPQACVHNLSLFFSAHRALSACCEWALNIRTTVQYNLYLGTVCALGTKEQIERVVKATRMGELGCFCLTEKVKCEISIEMKVHFSRSILPQLTYSCIYNLQSHIHTTIHTYIHTYIHT